MEKCPECNGAKKSWRTFENTCDNCLGHGCNYCDDGNIYTSKYLKCRSCEGSGESIHGHGCSVIGLCIIGIIFLGFFRFKITCLMPYILINRLTKSPK